MTINYYYRTEKQNKAANFIQSIITTITKKKKPARQINKTYQATGYTITTYKNKK